MPQRKIRPISGEDLYRFKLISDVRISPDGERIIYSLQRVEQKSEKKYSSLWLASSGRGAARQFTWGDHNDTAPRWSPNGEQIAFLSNRKDTEKPAQIYLIPTHGGEARPLSDIPGRIAEFAWSPDGKRLVCRVRKLDAEELEQQDDEHKKELGVVSRHYDRFFYTLDGDGYLPRQR